MMMTDRVPAASCDDERSDSKINNTEETTTMIDTDTVQAMIKINTRELEQQLAEARKMITVLQDDRQELRDQIDRIVERAHAEADRRDWPVEFDDLMEDLDLPRRTHHYRVKTTMTALVEIMIDVDAGTENEAMDKVNSGDHDFHDEVIVGMVQDQVRQGQLIVDDLNAHDTERVDNDRY